MQLIDVVEDQIKGTDFEGKLNPLFYGEEENYVKCVDVDYESTRRDTFNHLLLHMMPDTFGAPPQQEYGEWGNFKKKGWTVYDSLRYMCQEETLDSLYD